MHARQVYIKLDGEQLPVNPENYTITYNDCISDSSGTTEAGTTQRDVVREGIPSIGVKMDVSVNWLKKMRAFKAKASLDCSFLDPSTGSLSTRKMYIDQFRVLLIHDTDDGGLWSLYFNLEDIDDV